METPKNEAGDITELIMESVKRKLPEIDTYTYNRVYEAIYESLSHGDILK